MAYIVYLGKVLLPVTPSKITVKMKGQNKTESLIDGSQINILKPKGLTEISFDALIPQQAYSFSLYDNGKETRENYKEVVKQAKRKGIYEGKGYMRAKYYLDQFEKMKGSKQPFQFVVYREKPGASLKAKETSLFHTDMTVSLEDYTIKEDADEGMDLVVSINLKLFQPYGTKKALLKGKKLKVQVARVRDAQGRIKYERTTYVIRKGDTLLNIAKRYYGKSSKAGTIYKHNKKTLEKAAKKNGRKSSSNGQFLYKGTEIWLPKV